MPKKKLNDAESLRNDEAIDKVFPKKMADALRQVAKEGEGKGVDPSGDDISD